MHKGKQRTPVLDDAGLRCASVATAGCSGSESEDRIPSLRRRLSSSQNAAVSSSLGERRAIQLSASNIFRKHAIQQPIHNSQTSVLSSEALANIPSVQDCDENCHAHNTIFSTRYSRHWPLLGAPSHPHRFPARAMAAAWASDWTLTGTLGPMVELTDARRRYPLAPPPFRPLGRAESRAPTRAATLVYSSSTGKLALPTPACTTAPLSALIGSPPHRSSAKLFTHT